MSTRSKMRPAITLAAIVILAAGAIWLVRSRRPRNTAVDIATQTVDRHDISLTIEASGTIEPVDPVEVKSKASGTITVMPVSVGSRVKHGDLMVQIDARDVRNQYDSAKAALDAAVQGAGVEGARSRADTLFAPAWPPPASMTPRARHVNAQARS
jgi:multidrug efflux pump subunit AcrA (membrane-fusion protein)